MSSCLVGLLENPEVLPFVTLQIKLNTGLAASGPVCRRLATPLRGGHEDSCFCPNVWAGVFSGVDGRVCDWAVELHENGCSEWNPDNHEC